MNALLTDRSEEIARLCRKYGVRALYVFGSITRSDFDPVHSDADFLVEFEPASAMKRTERYFALQRDLSSLLARRVDLTEEGSLHNPYISAAIHQQKHLLYAA